MADDTTTETGTDSTGRTNVTTDRETMRTWVEDSGSTPAFRTGESGEREPYVHHPDSPTENVEETSWDEFYDYVEENELALVRHADRPEEGNEQFELVDRTEAIERATLEDEEVEQALLEGETVETEITETKVVERTVRETETIESEVVDSEVVSDEVLDTQLVRREIVNVHIGDVESDAVETEGERTGTDAAGAETDADGVETDAAETDADGEPQANRAIAIVEDRETVGFDEEADELDVTEYEVVTVDVDETHEVTRELIERKTVESQVVDRDVEETETVESDTLESRVDLEGVQRSVLESDVLGGQIATEEAIESGHVESEFTDEGVVETDLYERRVVRDEVVDRKRLTFEFAGEELLGSETATSTLVETALVGSDATGDVADSERTELEGVSIDREEAPVGEAMTSAESESTTDMGSETTDASGETAGDEIVALDDRDVGKDVVDGNDETVGVVTEVDEDAGVLYVDPNPGLAQRVKTRLGWEGHDEDAYSVEADHVAEIDGDRVQLRNM